MIAFTHGVASGDPTDDGAVLWTRLLDDARPTDPVPATCRVAGPDGMVIREVPVCADPSHDHTVHVVVDGLEPGTRYTYWFEANGVASREGRFRTLPSTASSVSFAVVSCAKYNAGHFNAYGRIAARDDLCFVLHLGDCIYEAVNLPPKSQTPGANIGRDFDPLHECRTLADYRTRFAQYRSDPDLQDLHAAHAIVPTIDDHELADNAWTGGAEEHRDAEHGPWSERVRAAMTAWEEWMPTRCRPATGGAPIHRSVRIGSLATIALVETRLGRSDPAEPDPAKRTQLGADQLAWLRRVAADADTDWLVLAVPSTLVSLLSERHAPDAVAALVTLKIACADGTGAHPDLWDAYPVERDRIVDALASSPARALVLSGDVHVSIVADIRRDGRAVATEWTVPSVTSQNLDDKMQWGCRTLSLRAERALCRSLDHLRYCNFDDHGYLVVRLEEAGVRGEWWHVGTVLERSPVERFGYSEWIPRHGD